MQKKEKEKSTENPVEQLTFPSIPSPATRRFKSKYTALISILKQNFTEKDIRKETAIIKKIIAKGFTEKQLYRAYNYRVFVRKCTVTSFALFLWKDCQLLKEAIPVTITEEELSPKLDLEDHRTDKEFKPKPKTMKDFLS